MGTAVRVHGRSHGAIGSPGHVMKLRSASSPAVPFRGAPIDDGAQDDDEDDVGEDDAGSAVGGRTRKISPGLRASAESRTEAATSATQSPVYPTDDPDRLLPHCCFGEGASCRSIPSRCLPSQHRGRQIDAAVRRELVNRHPARLLLLDPRSPLRFRRLRHPANLGRGIGAEQMVSTRGLRAKRRLYPRRGDHSASGASSRRSRPVVSPLRATTDNKPCPADSRPQGH